MTNNIFEYNINSLFKNGKFNISNIEISLLMIFLNFDKTDRVDFLTGEITDIYLEFRKELYENKWYQKSIGSEVLKAFKTDSEYHGNEKLDPLYKRNFSDEFNRNSLNNEGNKASPGSAHFYKINTPNNKAKYFPTEKSLNELKKVIEIIGFKCVNKYLRFEKLVLETNDIYYLGNNNAPRTYRDKNGKIFKRNMGNVKRLREYLNDPAKLNGKCENNECNKILFLKENNEPYSESHHIIPLYTGAEEDNLDTIENMVIICPDCHRKAHYSKEKDYLRDKFIQIVKKREI